MNNSKIIESKNAMILEKKWYIVNIILFFVSIIFLKLGINAIKYLVNADEYTLGIGMIFFIPIFVLLFGMFTIGVGITSLVFEIISMKKILTQTINIIFKIIVFLEIGGYIYFIYTLFIK